jgi:hypothetical protein
MSPLCDSRSTYSLHLLHHWNLQQTLCCYLCAVFGPSSRPPSSRARARFRHAMPCPTTTPSNLSQQAAASGTAPLAQVEELFPCPYGPSQIVINLYRRREDAIPHGLNHGTRWG